MAAVATVGAIAGLAPVITGSGWLVQAVLVVAVVSVVGGLAARIGARARAVAAAQVGVLVVVLTVVHTPAQAIAGLLPGPASLAQGAGLLTQGVQVLQAQAAPVQDEAGLRLLLAAGAGLLILVVEALAVTWRRPALAGVPLLAVHAAGVLYAPGGLGAGYFLLAAAGFLALLASGGDGARGWGVRVRPGGRGAAGAGASTLPPLAALSVSTAVVVALAAPGAADLRTRPLDLFTATAGAGTSAGGVSSVNPLLDLREDLGSRSAAVVLRYTTDSPRPQPLRVVTVDTFTGQTWEPAPVQEATPLVVGEALPSAPGLRAATAAERYTTTVTIEALRQPSLPLPYPVATITALPNAEGQDEEDWEEDWEGAWEVDTDTLDVLATGSGRTAPRQRYTVAYTQVLPDPALLAAAPPPPAGLLERYTALPEDLPEVIAGTAAQVTEEEPSAYARAVALQEFFRGDGGFRYTLDAPEAASASAVADFLQARAGYCVHFASSMALMARTLGIPARVAVGFLPGERTGEGRWEVSADDAHAWPELYFEGAGWVRFEPTPPSRSGMAPSWTVPDVGGGPGVQEVPDPGATASPAPSDASSPAPGAPADAGQAPDTGTTTGGALGPWGGWWVSWWGVLALAAVALGAGALVAPRAARAVSSWWRWRRAERAADEASKVEAGWADLLERVSDLGLEIPASATPRQVGRLLAPAPAAGAPPGPPASAGMGALEIEGVEGVPGVEGRAADVAAAVHRLVAALEGVRYGAVAVAVVHPPAWTGGDQEPPAVLGAGALSAGLRQDAALVTEEVAARVHPRAAARARWWPASRRVVLRGLPRALRSLGRR